MRRMIERIVVGVVLGGVLGMLPVLPAVADPVGTVLSAEGGPVVASGEASRLLVRGGAIQAGESLVTGAGERASLAFGDVFVQLEEGTTVEIGTTADGAPSFNVITGSLRLLDARAAGAPRIEIRTPHTSAHGTGIDTEIVVSELTSEFCEATGGLGVVHDSSGLHDVAAGQCATVRRYEPLALSGKGEPRIAFSGAGGYVGVALTGHFLPDVAAPAPVIGLAPLDPDRLMFGPCDGSGGGCGGTPQPRNPIIFEQPPEPPECPPGQCECTFCDQTPR